MPLPSSQNFVRTTLRAATDIDLSSKMCNFIQYRFKGCNHDADNKKLTRYCEIRQRIVFPPLHSWLSPHEMRFLEASCARFTEIREIPRDGKCLDCERAEQEAKKEEEEKERKTREMGHRRWEAALIEARRPGGPLELWRRRWKSPEARATEARRLALEASMDRKREEEEHANS